MSAIKAGLYACDPTALAEIVDGAIAKLAEHVDNPAASRDRVTLALELVGIEVGELRHAVCAERDLAKKQLREANAEIEKLRRELAAARRAA